jgi:DNA helicase-2/ATP-dependent DNA helicase PcrA
MSETFFQQSLAKLSDIQTEAVTWGEGALLVLAGPGSGKTQVLTCRIARLLDESRDKSFRVLALTFTNKAADEMIGRVREFVPGLEERANIGTFHSFCGQILRQHGVHLGIKPDFAIYSLDDDRRSVLDDAIQRGIAETKQGSAEDVRYLPLIDKLKSNLIEPDRAAPSLVRFPDAEAIIRTYRLYEEELRRVNALDFNSLIFDVYSLATTFPAIAAQYRRTYPYWLLDEFQDTNDAQYRLLKALAGETFKNIFAVADDDQIIYQWNGASFRQIQRLTADFSASSIQLSTNHRCPPAIVEAANRLVAYNALRTQSKQPLVAGKTVLQLPPEQHLQLRTFADDAVEAAGIAQEISQGSKTNWRRTAVLARTRALLEKVHENFKLAGVPSIIVQRRDDFLSAEFRWLVAFLRESIRPLDKRNLGVLVESFNRIIGQDISADQIVTDAEVSGESYLSTWTNSVRRVGNPESLALLSLAEPVANDRSAFRVAIDKLLAAFATRNAGTEAESDLKEDDQAWHEITREIASHVGATIPLDQFLQELQLRSKEPTPNPTAVTLMTIHGAKGREFDFVYVIGLAEDIMPSFQSRKKGDQSPEMEEERRNCFVAITRAKECLVLSRAEKYRGYQKQPSRFLIEMQLVPPS